MEILTNQVMLHFPADLTPLIHSFVRHVTRSDWKTCKCLESSLIRHHTEEILPICVESFTDEECEEIFTWTLAGQKIMLKKTSPQNHWTHHRFPFQSPDPNEDVLWYPQRLLWIRYGRYYMGLMR